jgi:hypothetical protein
MSIRSDPLQAQRLLASQVLRLPGRQRSHLDP